MSVYLGRGSSQSYSTKTSTTGITPYYLATANFNGDMVADLAVVNQGANSLNVCTGANNGNFTLRLTLLKGSQATFVSLGDINGDG